MRGKEKHLRRDAVDFVTVLPSANNPDDIHFPLCYTPFKRRIRYALHCFISMQGLTRTKLHGVVTSLVQRTLHFPAKFNK